MSLVPGSSSLDSPRRACNKYSMSPYSLQVRGTRHNDSDVLVMHACKIDRLGWVCTSSCRRA